MDNATQVHVTEIKSKEATVSTQIETNTPPAPAQEWSSEWVRVLGKQKSEWGLAARSHLEAINEEEPGSIRPEEIERIIALGIRLFAYLFWNPHIVMGVSVDSRGRGVISAKNSLLNRRLNITLLGEVNQIEFSKITASGVDRETSSEDGNTIQRLKLWLVGG